MVSSSAPRRTRDSKRAVAWRRLRAVGALLLSLGAAGTLFLVGRPWLQEGFPIAPLVNSGFSTRENGSNSRRKLAVRDPNSPSAIAADWLAAWQSPAKPPVSRTAPVSAKSRFGVFAPQPVLAALDAATPPTSFLFGARNSRLSLDAAPPNVSVPNAVALPIVLPPVFRVQDARVFSFPRFANHTLTLVALGEARAQAAARQHQISELQRFLRDAQRADAAILASEQAARLRLLDEEIARLTTPDLPPLSVPLPDAQTQLEMTNLRLRLNPAWRTADAARDAREREAARVRLSALERAWSDRLQNIGDAREQELARLREERPRALRQAGRRQLAEELRAREAASAQARAQLSRRVQLQLRQEWAPVPMKIKVGRALPAS